MPLADWITEHLLELHHVGFGAENPNWTICAVSVAMVCATLLYLRVKPLVTFGITAVVAGVVFLGAASHHSPDHLFDTFGVSWHVIFLWLAAGTLITIMTTAAGDDGEVPGKLRGAVEVGIGFVNDMIVEPVMGEGGRPYLPMILSFFFFVFTCNLLGLIPGGTTATGSFYCTGGLAGCAVLFYHGMGAREQGLVNYIVNIVPVHANMTRVGLFVAWSLLCGVAQATFIEAPVAGGLVGAGLLVIGGFNVGEIGSIVLWLFLLVIEIIGHMAKPFALTVRLFANMTGGHAVVYVLIGTIFMFQTVLVAPISIGATVAIYFLELLVAAIQAFVFTILVTVFLQGAIHPEH